MRNLLPFTVLSLIVYTPRILYAFVMLPTLRPGRDLQMYKAVSGILAALLSLIVTSALIYGVLEQLRGKRAGIGACLRVGLTRLLPVVGVALCVFAILFAVAAPFGILVVLFRAPPLALIIPAAIALVVYSRYWLAVPAAVVERPGVVASIKRSAHLTRGGVRTIFTVLLVFQALQFLAGLLVGLTAKTVSAVGWGTLVVTILFGTWTAVANAVAYHDLRVAKEGVGIEDLVRVFA